MPSSHGAWGDPRTRVPTFSLHETARRHLGAYSLSPGRREVDPEEVVSVALSGFGTEWELKSTGVVKELRSHEVRGFEGAGTGQFADIEHLPTGRKYRVTVTEE